MGDEANLKRSLYYDKKGQNKKKASDKEPAVKQNTREKEEKNAKLHILSIHTARSYGGLQTSTEPTSAQRDNKQHTYFITR